jgi:hypothetical protein
MHKFDLQGVDIFSLEKVLRATFPDSNFEISNTVLEFSAIGEQQQHDIQKILNTLRTAAKFEALNSKYPGSYILQESNCSYVSDVHVELELRGDIVWLGNGLATLSGDFLKVKRSLEKYWADYALVKLLATEIENPALWSSKIASQSKYLSDFPHEATFVFGAKKDGDSIANLGALTSKEGFPNDTEDLSSVIGSLTLLGFCQPAVCTSCYYAIGKRREVSNSLFTTYNRVFRNEGIKRLDRLLSFSVRDLMVVGSDEFVRNSREIFLNKASNFINELKLEAQLVRATDPFFAAKSSKLFVQKTGDLKHEIQAWIPYEARPIAVGSINLHLDTFGERFLMNIENRPASSACFGIGFERLTYSLFAQNGPVLKNWDKQVLDTLRLQ